MRVGGCVDAEAGDQRQTIFEQIDQGGQSEPEGQRVTLFLGP